jgi:hypothetical protein
MRLPILPWLLASALCAVSSAAQCTEAIVFEHQSFEGRRLVVHDATPALDRAELNDRAQSILIREGVWDVCTEAQYRGQCERLGPGEYRRLPGDIANRISSGRRIQQQVLLVPPYGER